MNERIKELAEQCGMAEAADVKAGYIYPPNMEKFAELIVRECIQSIKNTIQTVCDTDSEKMGCEFAITDLIQHFGVES
jgi:hypothetical protein